MKNLFLTKTRWLVTIILLTALGSGNVWGAEVVAYTLTCPKNTSNSAYGTTYDATISDIQWNAHGNQYADGDWRFGGNSISKTDRRAYSKTQLNEDITKIIIAFGAKSTSGITINSVKFNVYSTAEKAAALGDGDVSTHTLTYSANGTETITVPSGKSWNGRWYSVIFNVTVSGKSNKYAALKSITFYKEATPPCTSISPSLSYASVGGTTLTVGSSSSGSPTITGNTGSGTVTYSSSNTSVATVNSNTGVVTAVAAGNATITASIAAKGDYCEGSATANFTIEAPRYTVSFNTGTGNPTQADITEASAGAGITLPDGPTPACSDDGWVFVGWAESSCSETTTAPELLAAGDEITPESDMTLYAVYRKLTSGTSTATFNAADISNLTTHSTYNRDWRDNTGGIELYISDGQHYTGGSTKTWTVTNGTSNYALVDAHTKISSISITISGTNYKVGSVDKDAGTAKLSTSGTSQTVTCSGDVTQVYLRATSNYQIRMTTFTVTYYNAKFDSNPTCQACVAPTSVTITGTNKYLGGQTISLTAAPEGGTGTPSYQWQKKISGVWTNLANDGSISGVASNNLQISSCTHANSGGYRCIVSTGDGCETKSHADGTDGYGVHVFSIHGKYTTDADYSDTEIIWTSETTGTATISMDAKKTYLFKVWSNNGNYYGHGANTNEDFMFQPTTWDCGVNNNEMRLFTTVAGNYTFTVNIEHGLDGSPYVNVQVGYPSMTHPNSGYVYVQKFNWQPYLHYWYDNSHPLSTWGSDPQLAANQYTSICGTDYWCVPVIDYYCNFIAKDAAGNPSNTTGDQHTNSPHPGQRLYNDGSWKWGEFSTYTITYAGGDGSTGGPMASHIGLCSGSSQRLTVNAFSKAYHTFNGWSDGNGHTYADQAMIENIQSNINLTAQWTKTPVEELLLNYSELNKYVGDPAVTLEVTGVTPEGADASVTWSSSNPSVAPVEAATGVVSFSYAGTATITATSTVTGTTTAVCNVTVRNKPTATFVDLIHNGNGTDLSTYYLQDVAGTSIVFPTLSNTEPGAETCEDQHYIFVGWTTSDNNDDPQDHLVTSGALENDVDKTFYAVWADGKEGYSYTQLTSNSFESAPTKYVIGVKSSGTMYYFNSCAKTGENNSWGYTTNDPTNNPPIQFTLSGTASELIATSTEATARYIVPMTTADFKMSTSSQTLTLNEDGTIHNTGTNNAYALRGNSANLRWYKSGTGNPAYFYKVEDGSVVSYRTSCCANNVAAPSVTATKTAYTVTLTWAAVDGATGYEVSWNNGAWTAASSPLVKSTLTASTTYTYKVRATYNEAVHCGARVASGNVTTDDVYSVTYSGGTGTGSCSPTGSVAAVTYEAGATVTLAATNSFSLTSNTFAAWVVKDAENNDVAVSNNQFTMPASNVTVTATWTAVQDKYYDRMHQSTDASHGGIADGNGKYYIVREGCNYTVPSPADDKTGDTDCHTTHFKLLGWIAQSHLKSDGSIKDGEESYIFQGGTIKSATGATYYAVYAIMTE